MVDYARLSWFDQQKINALRAITPGTRGKARLARFLLKSVLDERDVLVKNRYGVMLMPSLREPIAFHTLIDGVYETELVQLMYRLLHMGGTFVDVGANVGVLSLIGSRIVGSRGKIIAIEPSPSIIGYLRRNVAENNLTNISIVETAVSATGPQTRSFWCGPTENFGMGALAAQFDKQPIEVPADTVDNILSAFKAYCVDLVKIDIEGFELEAFKGAHTLLTTKLRPPIVFEFADWAERRAGIEPGDAQRFVASLGYKLFAVERNCQIRRLKTAVESGALNVLAVPEEREASILEMAAT